PVAPREESPAPRGAHDPPTASDIDPPSSPDPVTRGGPRPGGAPAEPKKPTGTRIALVDDDKVTLAILSRALRRRGFLVRTFQDPESAVDVLCRDGPDIAVVDMQMPGITGIELVRQLEHRL